MAKIFGLFGAMTGKVADVVMVVRNGVQIARKYQPMVSNPKSTKQVASRAKMKLISQISAVMAPYIAIPKEGIVSSRNLFFRKNYPLVSFANNQASVSLTDIQLTDSVVGFPGISATRSGGSIAVKVNTITYYGVDRIVYVSFSKQTDGSLRFQSSAIATERGVSDDWPATLYAPNSNEVVIYAYGVRDNTNAARVYFGNLEAITAETIAKLVVTRVLLDSDITLTETKGIQLAAAE